MIYDVVNNHEYKNRLIEDTIYISKLYLKKFNIPCPYIYTVDQYKLGLSEYLKSKDKPVVKVYNNQRNTQHFVWYAKMLNKHYEITKNKSYYNLSKEIMDFVCENHCFEKSKILTNWFEVNDNLCNLVSLKSLTCSEMFLIHNKLSYFEHTFNYLCKYAYKSDTKLFDSYVNIVNNISVKKESSYLHENLELAEGLFNVYEFDKDKYKIYFNYASDIVKETFKFIPNNVNNLAPLQCYYWGLKYNLLNNEELKILVLHINEFIIEEYEKHGRISAYKNKTQNNIFPYIYLQRIYNLVSNDKPKLFTEFLKKRGRNYDKKIEYYEDKINTPSILEKLDIRLPKRYFILDNVDEIRNVRLPDNCVIKYNNLAGARGIIFRKNGIFTNNFDLNQVINFLKKNNKQNRSCQISIKNIVQKIIVEELLIDDSKKDFLMDIKLYCFKGVVHYIYMYDYWITKTWRHYDINFKRVKLKTTDDDITNYHKKPKYLNEIINYGNKIAKELLPDTFVRLDFYSTTKGAVFGEFTFKPGSSGFLKNADRLLGQLL